MKPSAADEAAVRSALDLLIPPFDDVPIAAVVVDPGGQLLAGEVNRRGAGTDPTAHAEVAALRAAGAARGSWRLDGCTLVATLEPCPMCAGAAVSARISRIVFGAWNPEYGACGSLFDIPRDRRLHHRAEVVGGVLAAECSTPLESFFTERRASDKTGLALEGP